MVEVRETGDLFTCGTQAIVNTVNCKGIMGRGIALEFKNRYPEMYQEYVRLCRRNRIQVGRVWLWHEITAWHTLVSGKIAAGTGESLTSAASTAASQPEYIINFPTKDDWRFPSKIEWIEKGLDDLKYCVILFDIVSIALPALGCQNGGLRFEDVRPLVEEKLNGITVQACVDDKWIDTETSVILFQPR